MTASFPKPYVVSEILGSLQNASKSSCATVVENLVTFDVCKVIESGYICHSAFIIIFDIFNCIFI